MVSSDSILIVAAIVFASLIIMATSSTSVSVVPSPLDVSVQDQTSPQVDFYFTRILAPPTTVAIDTIYDTYNITVVSATGCAIDDYLGTFNADNSTNNRAYFGTIVNIVGNTIFLDTPLDFTFLAGDTVGCFTRNLNEDGSVDRVIFSVQIGPAATQCIDITRLMFSFITDSAVDLNKFGDIPSLDNGLVIRRVNGFTNNIYNVKNNGELANLCFDYDPQAASNPQQGQDGAKFRCSSNGPDKHGVAIRLCPGDKLEGLIQDDYKDLNQFRIIAEGHYVVD